MSLEPRHILKAAAHARRAIRRGELARAERWLALVERALAVTSRLTLLARLDAERRQRRAAA